MGPRESLPPINHCKYSQQIIADHNYLCKHGLLEFKTCLVLPSDQKVFVSAFQSGEKTGHVCLQRHIFDPCYPYDEPWRQEKILLVKHCSFISARMDNCRAGAICMQSAIFRGYHLGTHRPIVLKIQAALKNYYYLMRVNPVVPTMQGPIPMPPWRS